MKRDTSIIQSLDKGLFLLEVIQQENRPVALNDIWEKVGWDKATIHRMLRTLEKKGYLLRNNATKRYTLGLKIFALYDSLIRTFDIQPVTRPFLEDITKITGETAHLAIPIGKDIVFIDRIASSETLSVTTQIGAKEPSYCTALGRAFLAFADEADLSEYLPDPIPQYTSRTITDAKKLKGMFETIRSKGYAIDNEEYIDGIRCVAAPILNHLGFPIAAIGISGPKNRITLTKANEYGQKIKSAGLQISRFAGYHNETTPSSRLIR